MPLLSRVSSAALAAAGPDFLYRRLTGFAARALALTYHRVLDGRAFFDPTQDYVSVVEFERQVRYAARRRTAVTFGELLARGGRGPILAVTFDDGYGDNYRAAFPVLRRLGIPATVFLTTDAVGGRRWLWWDHLLFALNRRLGGSVTVGGEQYPLPDEDAVRRVFLSFVAALKRSPAREAVIAEIAAQTGVDGPPPAGLYLTWDQVRELARAGWELGAHTRTHCVLTSVPPERARYEIASSLVEIERETGIRPRVFAYPNGRAGDFDDGVISILRDEGLAGAATTIGGPASFPFDPFRVNRVAPRGRESFSTFRLRLSGLYDELRALRGRLR